MSIFKPKKLVIELTLNQAVLLESVLHDNMKILESSEVAGKLGELHSSFKTLEMFKAVLEQLPSCIQHGMAAKYEERMRRAAEGLGTPY